MSTTSMPPHGVFKATQMQENVRSMYEKFAFPLFDHDLSTTSEGVRGLVRGPHSYISSRGTNMTLFIIIAKRAKCF